MGRKCRRKSSTRGANALSVKPSEHTHSDKPDLQRHRQKRKRVCITNQQSEDRVNLYNGWAPSLSKGKAASVAVLDEPSQLKPEHFWASFVSSRRPAVIRSHLAAKQFANMRKWTVDSMIQDAVRSPSIILIDLAPNPKQFDSLNLLAATQYEHSHGHGRLLK